MRSKLNKRPSYTRCMGRALGGAVALLGCNRGPATVGDNDVPADVPSDAPDLPGDLPPELPPDLPPACEPPLLECPEDGCVDPRTNRDHCGECDHHCIAEMEGVGAAGGCIDGECLPTWFGCDDPTQVEYSCAEVCGGPHEETCVENGCAGATIMWEVASEFDTSCDHVIIDPSRLQQESCDMPISQAYTAAGLPDLEPGNWWNAACCCTTS